MSSLEVTDFVVELDRITRSAGLGDGRWCRLATQAQEAACGNPARPGFQTSTRVADDRQPQQVALGEMERRWRGRWQGAGELHGADVSSAGSAGGNSRFQGPARSRSARGLGSSVS